MKSNRILIIAMSICFMVGCTSYPEVSTRDGLTYIAALRTACSSKNPARLAKVEQAINQAHSTGQLTEKEAKSFRRIIEQAKAGRWESAEDACVDFQTAQVR